MKRRDAPRLIDKGSVWILVAAPSVWAAHFLLSYWVAAIWCAKVAPGQATQLGPVSWAVVIMGGVALAIILWLAWVARRHYRGMMLVDDEITGDTAHARDVFLGHVTLLLCALSAVAIVFTTIPALMAGTCW